MIAFDDHHLSNRTLYLLIWVEGSFVSLEKSLKESVIRAVDMSMETATTTQHITSIPATAAGMPAGFIVDGHIIRGCSEASARELARRIDQGHAGA